MIGEENGYKEHYNRLLRFRSKLNDYENDQKEFQDNMWAFFQTSHHLKDWLKESHPLVCDDVENYINNSSFLKVGADLANRSKHLLLKKARGGDADIKRNSVSVEIPPINISVSLSFGVNESSKKDIPNANAITEVKTKVFWSYFVDVPDGQSFDAVELADKILIEWRHYLDSKNI